MTRALELGRYEAEAATQAGMIAATERSLEGCQAEVARLEAALSAALEHNVRVVLAICVCSYGGVGGQVLKPSLEYLFDWRYFLGEFFDLNISTAATRIAFDGQAASMAPETAAASVQTDGPGHAEAMAAVEHRLRVTEARLRASEDRCAKSNATAENLTAEAAEGGRRLVLETSARQAAERALADAQVAWEQRFEAMRAVRPDPPPPPRPPSPPRPDLYARVARVFFIGKRGKG